VIVEDLKDPQKMSMAEIASEISARLKNLERLNLTINGRARYYHASASVAGPRVYVQHISYQGGVTLSRAQAVCYLSLLREGETPSFSHPRILSIRQSKDRARRQRKKDREEKELASRRETYEEDVICAVHIPAQVVYVVGRETSGDGKGPNVRSIQREAANLVTFGPILRVQPNDVPEEDLDKIPGVPYGYDFKDQSLVDAPIKNWPRK